MFGAKNRAAMDDTSGRREKDAREPVVRKVRARVFGISPRTSALHGWRAMFLSL
jgi:hypothetical protein